MGLYYEQKACGENVVDFKNATLLDQLNRGIEFEELDQAKESFDMF